MAKPIEATPILKGEDIYNFIAEMEKVDNMSIEEKRKEREKIEHGAEIVKSWLTFDF